MRAIYFFTAILLLAGACVERGSNNKDAEEAYDQTPGDEEHQTNTSADIVDNSEIEKNSFTTSPYFAKWDTNGDKKVDEQEFDNHYFEMLDKNGDGKLDKSEWETAVKSFFGGNGELNYGKLSNWDKDGNNQVSKDEFIAYLKDKKIFNDWASGDAITEPQFAKGVFQHWDTDGNGVVESEEFTEEYNRTGDGI